MKNLFGSWWESNSESSEHQLRIFSLCYLGHIELNILWLSTFNFIASEMFNCPVMWSISVPIVWISTICSCSVNLWIRIVRVFRTFRFNMVGMRCTCDDKLHTHTHIHNSYIVELPWYSRSKYDYRSSSIVMWVERVFARHFLHGKIIIWNGKKEKKKRIE